MAVATTLPIKMSDVCQEIYGSASTVGKSQSGLFTAATGTFDPTYESINGYRNSLQNFRGYVHTSSWDISNSTADGTKDISANLAVGYNISGIYASPDGTKLYLLDYTEDKIYQFSMSVAYDVTTLTHVATSGVISSNYTYANPSGLAFNSTGTKMYIIEGYSTSFNKLHQHSLSTAWDITTASATIDSTLDFGTITGGTIGRNFVFNAAGTKLFYVYKGISAGTSFVKEYTLSTGFNLTTANSGVNNQIADSIDSVSIGLIDSESNFVMNDTTGLRQYSGLSSANFINKYTPVGAMRTAMATDNFFFSISPIGGVVEKYNTNI